MSDYDVIVVGAGNAALCSALSAHENGAKVLVLERAPIEERGGNSYFTAGGFRFAHEGLEDVTQDILTDLSDQERNQMILPPHSREFFMDQMREVTRYQCDEELAQLLVDRSREIWIAANNDKKRTGPEEDVYRFARASVVADADLPAGHVIREQDIWARRPGSGDIPGYEFDKVVGRTLKTAVTRNQQLTWDDLSDA